VICGRQWFSDREALGGLVVAIWDWAGTVEVRRVQPYYHFQKRCLRKKARTEYSKTYKTMNFGESGYGTKDILAGGISSSTKYTRQKKMHDTDHWERKKKGGSIKSVCVHRISQYHYEKPERKGPHSSTLSMSNSGGV
jgi:hypothetical protein